MVVKKFIRAVHERTAIGSSHSLEFIHEINNDKMGIESSDFHDPFFFYDSFSLFSFLMNSIFSHFSPC